MDEKKFEEFKSKFDTVLFPTIKGKDGNGLSRLKEIVEDKKEAVLKRQHSRKFKW